MSHLQVRMNKAEMLYFHSKLPDAKRGTNSEHLGNVFVFVWVYKIPWGALSSLQYGGGAGSIVWGLGFWLGKDILGFFKNVDLDNSQGVAKMIHIDN